MRKQKAILSSFLFGSLLTLFVLSVCGVAQEQKTVPAQAQQGSTQQEDKAQQGSAQQQPQAGESAEPERKITKEEAEALFRSVDEILQFASKDTGLPIKHPVKRKLASREEVKKYIDDRMKDDEDTKRLQRSEVVLKKFGLIPQQFNLRTFLAQLLQEQVAGFYDTKKKTVFLLDWVEPEGQKPVLAHELTHALQDQNFGLEKWMKAAEAQRPKKGKGAASAESAPDLMEDERMAARQAVSEGQAMVVLIDYYLAPQGQSVKKDPQIAEAVMAGMNASGETPLYTKAPMFLKQLLLFPYQRGLKFESDVLTKAGTDAAFAGAFREPPADTHQILQPEAYLRKQEIPLMPVPLFGEAAGKDYENYDVSVMGEFDVWLLGKQYANEKTAGAIAPGWRGGYYYAAVKPGAAKAAKGSVTVSTSALALAYASKWASADMAEQFAAVYANYVPKRYRSVHELTPVSAKVADDAGKVSVDVAQRMKGAHTWATDEGTVSIEVRGDTMLVMEGFDEGAAGRMRAAVFGK